MTDISLWYKSLPIFTKYWLTLTVGFSLFARFGILRGEWLYLEPYFVYHDLHVSFFCPFHCLSLQVVKSMTNEQLFIADMAAADMYILLPAYPKHWIPFPIKLLLPVQLFVTIGNGSL